MQKITGNEFVETGIMLMKTGNFFPRHLMILRRFYRQEVAKGAGRAMDIILVLKATYTFALQRERARRYGVADAGGGQRRPRVKASGSQL